MTTRVALVTGAAQGIGRAIALRLAADGLDVAVDDVPHKSHLLDGVVQEISEIGRKAIAFKYDVTKEDDVKQMVEDTVRELGRLDVVGRPILHHSINSFILIQDEQMVANAGVASGQHTIMEGGSLRVKDSTTHSKLPQIRAHF